VDTRPTPAVAAPTGAIRTPEPAGRTGSGVIDVYLRDLSQLFHSMDPSPFHEKALDPDAEEFIVSSAKELPGDVAPSLVVFVDQLEASPKEVSIVSQAIRVHFARRAEMKRRELRQLLRLGRISLGIGVPILAISVGAGNLVAQSMSARPLAEVLRESLVIGGWVAMWRPMELLLYDWWPVRNDQRLFQQLSRMEVRVIARVAPSDDR
jgi:hypothetical protein